MTNKIPYDVKEEIKEMLDDGLTCANVANYLGVPLHVVQYVRAPERIKAAGLKWRNKKKEVKHAM